jgi:hypothetical protein
MHCFCIGEREVKALAQKYKKVASAIFPHFPTEQKIKKATHRLKRCAHERQRKATSTFLLGLKILYSRLELLPPLNPKVVSRLLPMKNGDMECRNVWPNALLSKTAFSSLNLLNETF